VCVSIPPIVPRQRLGTSALIVARQRLGKNPPIAARQRLGKNSLIVARQRLGKNPPIVARQRLGKNSLIVARKWFCRNVTAVMNTHATTEELLDASFLMWPEPYQGK
jgi:UDP-3-O-[3-hydroxymyristoyl] glucosamine N-acyltransferase